MTAKEAIVRFKSENNISEITAKNLEKFLNGAIKKEKVKSFSWPEVKEYFNTLLSVNDIKRPSVLLIKPKK